MNELQIVLKENVDSEYETRSAGDEEDHVEQTETKNGDEQECDEDNEAGNGDEEEDIVGRYEFEIEEEVADFVDEEFRERHTIPESSDESENDDLVVKKNRMGKKKRDMLALGTKFYTGYQFKQVVVDYALSKGRNIRQD